MDAITYSQLEHLAEQQLIEIAQLHCAIPSTWVADHWVTPELLQATIERLRGDGKHSNFFALARCTSGQLVGMHWVQYAEAAHASHGEVRSLWVKPGFRKRGIATWLKHLAEQWLQQHGATEIRTEVFTANRKMLSLNQTLGYQTVMQVMSKSLHPLGAVPP